MLFLRPILRFVLRVSYVTAAVLLGNWVGDQLRTQVTGEAVQTLQHTYTSKRGTKIRNIPVLTKFYPALLASLVGRPHWLYAFIGGVITGGLVDDRFEDYILEQLDQKLSQLNVDSE